MLIRMVRVDLLTLILEMPVSVGPDFETPWDCSPQGFSVYGIFQARDTWSELPFPLQGIFPTQRWNSRPCISRQIL